MTFDAAERVGLRGKKEMSLIEIVGNKPVAKETQRQWLKTTIHFKAFQVS